MDIACELLMDIACKVGWGMDVKIHKPSSLFVELEVRCAEG